MKPIQILFCEDFAGGYPFGFRVLCLVVAHQKKHGLANFPFSIWVNTFWSENFLVVPPFPSFCCRIWTPNGFLFDFILKSQKAGLGRVATKRTDYGTTIKVTP